RPPRLRRVCLRSVCLRPARFRPVSARPVSARPVSARPVSARPVSARRPREPLMEFRSRPAGGLSPGTDPAALRVITAAVLVSLVASGVALASGLGLLAGGAGPQRSLAGLAHGPAQAAGLKLLRAAAQACRSLPYRGVEVAWWGPGSQTGGDTSVVQVWHQPGGQTLTQAPAASLAGPGQRHQPVSSLGSGGPNLDEAGALGMSTQLVSLLAANYVVTVA